MPGLHRRARSGDRAEPDSVLAFLAWLGEQGWSVWIKITLFVVMAGVAGGGFVASLADFLR
jgi:hypothetical protein